MQPWITAGVLVVGGVVVTLLGVTLTVASSRAKSAEGGPLIRQDFAMVVVAIGVVAVVFGAGLLVFRATRPF